MRLTLRTLLSYMDDTLEPALVKKVGQKVTESDTAQELIARIKQVTRRRRLTVPPDGADETLDANKTAQYLDYELSEDDVAQVEQICLASDVHLAEVAACHQILTLVTGEPMLIPPTSQQRMYALVKGKEAAPMRRPPADEVAQPSVDKREVYETDETLRMGLPSFAGSGWKGRVILIVGGLAACALLVVAVFQALQLPFLSDRPDPHKRTVDLPKKKKAEKVHIGPPKNGKKDKQQTPKKKNGAGKKTNTKKKKKSDPAQPTVPDVPVEKPSTAIADAGVAVSQERGLFQRTAKDVFPWQQIGGNTKVKSGLPLVSLPGFKSTVRTNSGIVLDLWGMQPEQALKPSWSLWESAVVLHKHDKLDLELTLRRGRILLTNGKDAPVHVRIRFNNPTDPKLEGVWDIVLPNKESQIMLERWTALPSSERYFTDSKSKKRKGPRAFQTLLVLKGKIDLKERSLTESMQQPSGKAFLRWDSFAGTSKIFDIKIDKNNKLVLVPGEDDLPKSMDEKAKAALVSNKTKMSKARQALHKDLGDSPITTVLPSYRKSANRYQNMLALRCYLALDDLPALLDAVSDENKDGVFRKWTIDMLKRWITYERDNAYALRKELLTKNKQNFNEKQTEEFMWLLHNFSRRDWGNKATYQALIEFLNSSNIAIRQLAGHKLYTELNLVLYDAQKSLHDAKVNDPKIQFKFAPVGGAINYDPSAEIQQRVNAQQAWQKLVNDGELPPKELQ